MQWWNVTKYIYSGAVFKYKTEVLVLNLNIYILCNFILLFHYISEANIVLFTSLHLSDSFSYKLVFRLQFFIPFLSSENHASPNLVILNVTFGDKLKD